MNNNYFNMMYMGNIIINYNICKYFYKLYKIKYNNFIKIKKVKN